MMDDPPIDELRRIREQIAAEHDHDPHKLVQHYMQYQQRFQDRLVDYGSRREVASLKATPKDAG